MSPVAHCGMVKQKQLSGILCHCCSGTNEMCIKSLCPMCTHDTGVGDHAAWLYDTLLSAFSISVHFQSLYFVTEKTPALETAEGEVPYKPPEL